MQGKSFYASLIWTVCFATSGIAQSQQTKTLTVDGHPGHVAMIEVNGKSCVEIEALANLTNSSLSFNGNQIALTLHAAPVGQAASQGFSKAFLNAGIEAMSEIREWRSALQSAIQYGFPPNDDWVNRYRGAATSSVRSASVEASTESDRSASQLLGKELDHMQQLSDKMLAMRKNMTYIAPDALANNPLDQKIINCAHSLAAMAANGQFHDDGACH